MFLSLAGHLAAASVWEKTAGPPGLEVKVFYEADGYLYAGTDTLGVYRSSDKGQTWTAANGGLDRVSIRDIIKSGPNLLASVSTTCSGQLNVFRSTDNGTTWIPTTGLEGKVVKTFAAKGNFVYAGTFNLSHSGIFRSSDNGATWSELNSPIQQVDEMFVSGDAIILSDTNLIWRSVNEGASWQLVEQFALAGVQQFARAGTKLFGISGGNMMISTNNGASWDLYVFPGGGAASASGVGDTLYVGASGQVLKSTDFGATWIDVSSGLGKGAIKALLFDGTDLFAGTTADAFAVYHSVNGGANWSPAAAGLPVGKEIRTLKAFGNYIFAGTDSDGVYRSPDHGNTWAKMDLSNALLAQQIVFEFAVKDNTLFAGAVNGIYRSIDNGNTFQRILNGFPPNIGVTAYSLAVSGNNVVAAVSISLSPTQSQDGIFYSTDNGDSWHQASSLPSDMTGVEKVASDGGALVYAGVYTQSSFTTGLYKSFDGGQSWVSKTTVLSVDINEMAVKNNIVLASTLFTGYYSNDFGELSWSVSSLPDPAPNHRGIFTYTINGDTVYAGDGGMYYSLDNGATWTPFQEGFPGCPLPVVLASCADDRYVYAGTAGEGVWRRRLNEAPAAAAAFDYDGDGRTDISVFRPSDSNWYIERSRSGFLGTTFGLATDRIAPADLDGDGMTDISVYRPSTGTWYFLNSSNGSFSTVSFGSSEDLPTPAD